MKKRRPRWAMASIIGIIIIISLLYWAAGIQRNLVEYQQGVLAQEGRYGAALETLSEKIKGIWVIQRDFLEHERDTLTDVIKARAEALDRSGREFTEAVAQGDPDKTIEAATKFREAAQGLSLSVNVVALQEAYPQLFSPPIVQQTIRGLEEAVNEIRTALDDWQVSIRTYNTYRGQWPQSFIARPLGFPESYDYYKAEKAKLDMEKLMPSS
ncbi:MAG: LemA family protein [Firmicutes bacterium]|jgi:LemA protein|nr:LemA family protein [Bacillota bacterium]